MKEIKREVITTVTEYVAYDSTTFKDKSECYKYEHKEFCEAIETIRSSCLANYTGSDVTLLNGSLWGGDADEFFVVKVDNTDVLLSLNKLLHISDSTEALQQLHDAYVTESTVLVSVYDDYSFYWYGDLAHVVLVLAKDAERLFHTDN